MNRVLRSSPTAPHHLPVVALASAPRPTTTSFGQVPALTVTVSPASIAKRLSHRSLATSRRGYDHSWVGLIVMTALLFVAAAPHAQAEAALDHWTKVTVPDTIIRTPTDLIFAGGKYWATGSGGKVQYSGDGGATWHVVQTPSTQTLYAITYAQGRFVAVGNQQTILSSPNGTDWTLHREVIESPARPFKSVIHAGGRFVAVGGKGIVQHSSNGTEWTEAAMPATVNMNVSDVTYGNGLYVASGEGDGYYCIATSPDAITWTRRYISVGWGFKAVGFFNGVFVAGNISELFSSPDGITWAKLGNVPFKYTNTTIADIKVVNGRLFAFGSAGLVLSSTNGAEWTAHDTATTLDISALDYDGDRLLIFRVGIISSGNGPAKSDTWLPVIVNDEDPIDPVPVDPDAAANIANISTRAWVGTGDTKLITGFIVDGTTPKTVLVRAVGPTLAGYGVGGTLVDPTVTLFNAAGDEIASNNDWGTFANPAALTTESARVFAFALNDGSKDAAMLATLQPGSYTIHTSGADGGTGVALAEVYDCESGAPTKLVNISSRGYIGIGDNVGIPGFIVEGNKPKKLLVRGVGPTLANWGVPATLSDPKVTLYDANQVVVAENDNWGQYADQTGLVAASNQVSAFALNAGSNDAAMIVTVNPGLYTAIVAGTNNTTGVALVEVYEIE